MQVLVKRLQIIGSTLRARPVAQKADIVSKFSSFALAKFASGELKAQVTAQCILAWPAAGNSCILLGVYHACSTHSPLA